MRFRPAEATCGADQKERSLWERECLVPRTRARIRSADATRPNRLASLERNEAEMNCTLVRFSKKFTIMSLRVHDLFERSARLPKTSIVTRQYNATNTEKLFADKKKNSYKELRQKEIKPAFVNKTHTGKDVLSEGKRYRETTTRFKRTEKTSARVSHTLDSC